ncbi:hypothetical protein GCM10012289_18070 [Nonomuraea cavernae]|uniref:Uncharacterized protein n=1 Tax=Nonomuraea cavernae TaxID=2045107 RepID=A0A918DGT4_9ACTN|nr:hypothetical protein GCM10012289_18070 [Nonomuraea cavernae]
MAGHVRFVDHDDGHLAGEHLGERRMPVGQRDHAEGVDHRVAHGVAAAVAVRQRQDEQPDAGVLGGRGDALEEPDGVGVGEGVGQGLAEQQPQRAGPSEAK